MSASREQIQELSNAIALQAQAIADGTCDESAVYAQVRKLADNVDTLKHWTTHLNPSLPGTPTTSSFCAYCSWWDKHSSTCGRPQEPWDHTLRTQYEAAQEVEQQG